MPPRFKEICDLLLKGTENGSLQWEQLKTSDAVTVTVKGNIFILDLEIDSHIGAITGFTLRILNAKGDEIDSVGVSRSDGGFNQVMKIWESVEGQRELALSMRLRPIAEALRASVLGA